MKSVDDVVAMSEYSKSENLEQYGEGTAQLISLAIEEYCKK